MVRIDISKGQAFITDLKYVLKAMDGNYSKYNWLITDYECYPQEEKLAGVFSGEPVSIQHPLADIEIVAWDSSVTVVISKDENIPNIIKTNYSSTIDWEQYIEK